VIKHKKFRKGNFSTNFLPDEIFKTRNKL
jgi:hypothetical protein